MHDGDEDASGLPRFLLLVPVVVIVGAVVYLLAGSQSASKLVRGDATPTVTATEAPPLPPVPTPSATPSPEPTPPVALINRVRAYQVGYLTDEEVYPPAPAGPRWVNQMDERVIDNATWSPAKPILELVSQDRLVHRFRLDGLAPGEWVLLDRSKVFFNIGGHPMTHRLIDVEGRALSDGGAEITVLFDERAGGLFGPSFQLAVFGSSGTAVFATAPYVHHGSKPDPIYRLDDTIDEMWYEGPFRLYLPRELPKNSTITWTAHMPTGIGFVWNWVLPGPDGTWTSLVMVESNACQASRAQPARRMAECFGPVVAYPGPVERMRLGPYTWEVARAGPDWTIAGLVEGTYILYIGTDRETLITAAASTHP